MDRHVPVAFLESVVLPHIVEVISADDNRSLHLHFDNSSTKDSTPDGNTACKWTLLVDVFALDSVTGNLETQTNISGVPNLLLGYLLLEL